MSAELWFVFVLAALALSLTPGPNGLLCLDHGVRYGLSRSTYTALGAVAGMSLLIGASLAGLGAVMQASELLFTLVKWAGAAYLVWLGVKLWRAPVTVAPDVEPDAPRAPALRIALHTYAVTALNPKSIVFFVAFLPMFLDTAQPLLPQMAILEVTFIVLATLNAAAYGLMASLVRTRIRKPSVRMWINRAGGSMMIGAGLLAIGWRRAAAS